MQFIQINTYQDKKNPTRAGFVNQRLEYFHHYWNFALREKSRWLLFTNERLESHRSLFVKIKIQLAENVEWYPKRLRELVINHPYFSNSNILIRTTATTQKQIKSLTNSFHAKISNRSRDNGSQHLRSFATDLLKLEKKILGTSPTAYLQMVLNSLIKVLHTVRGIDTGSKVDIQFLANAIIIELYHFGYSPAYIRKILDIILFPRNHQFEFPYDKKRDNFSTTQEFNNYTTGVLGNLTLKKQLLAFLELVSHPKLKGFYVFKINNFNFSQTSPLEIWGVKFYNPQVTKQLYYRDDYAFNEYAEEIEKYFEQFVKMEDRDRLKSTCNAIVPTEYRPLNSNNVDQSVYKAIDKVNRSLSVLKNIKHLHVGGHSFETAIDLKSVIMTHENGAYHAAPYIHHDYNDDKPFELKEKAKKSVEDSLKWINKLNPKNPFHKKVIDISFAVNRYRYDPMSFSFRDFWITVADALFPNNPERFIDFAYACVELYLKDQTMTNLKIFLHDSLKGGPFSASHYSLTPKQMKKLGLEILQYKVIKAKLFSSRYREITKYHDFEFLRDILDDVRKFHAAPDRYFTEIKTTLRSVIFEVYAERNLEVHNNISTDFSLLKLSEFCTSLATIIRLVISQKINAKSKSISDLGII
jgi:hypothetical protein